MYSRFPFSMERIPRSSGFFCLSLKFGCIVTAIISLLYAILGLAACGAALSAVSPDMENKDRMLLLGFILVTIICHGVTFIFSAFLLVGILWDRLKFMKPWVVWSTFQTTAYAAIFIFMTTMQMINRFSNVALVTYLIDFLILVIRMYMLIMVVSHYKNIKEEKQEHKRLEKLINKEFQYSNTV